MFPFWRFCEIGDGLVFFWLLPYTHHTQIEKGIASVVSMIDQKILKHFQKTDPVLFTVAQKVELNIYSQIKPEDYFRELADSIVSQQLSGKAATTIFNRFLDLFPKRNLNPKAVLKIPDEKLRGVGLSRAKASYIKDLAAKVLDGTIELSHLQDLDDEKVIEELVAVKGIGRWTAEMFLMFTLGREDVFSAGDLGLMNGIKKLYGIEKPTKEQLLELESKWKPYRTTASRILWKSLTID